MLFIISIFLCVLLFFINRKNKLLIFLFLCLIGSINFILNIPKESKETWMYDLTALLIVLFIYIFLLISVNILMKVLLFFNQNKLKYEVIIRKAALSFCLVSALFASYMFFIKGVIYG